MQKRHDVHIQYPAASHLSYKHLTFLRVPYDVLREWAHRGGMLIPASSLRIP